tara:strand:- start:3147 stop:3344 length:198 start_codon:yes stop_codon:yes gene_type:complete
MDDWDKNRRQRRFKFKNIHDDKPEDTAQRPRKAPRKNVRNKIDPDCWQDHDDFYEEFSEEYEDFS